MMNGEQKAAFLANRCGKLTASNMWKAMDFKRDGKPTNVRTQYQHELLAERLTGFSVSHVVTDAMLFGAEHEDEAADAFVALTGREVKLSRTYDHPTIESFAATPDREIDDGLIEIKVPTSPKFVAWKLAGVVPAEHRPQMLAQLACTGKQWCGFVAYDPRQKEERHRLFLAKFEPRPEEIAAVEEAARLFLRELDEMWERFTTQAA